MPRMTEAERDAYEYTWTRYSPVSRPCLLRRDIFDVVFWNADKSASKEDINAAVQAAWLAAMKCVKEKS